MKPTPRDDCADPADGAPPAHVTARAIVVAGRVQGVGYRPFVYRTARSLALSGRVQNASGQVLIHVEGPEVALAAFERALVEEAPPLSRPHLVRSRRVRAGGCRDFEIEASAEGRAADVHLPPDQSICPDCLRELNDPGDRRHRHPFITCTACGPRYTLIAALPYDRRTTSMSGFPLCPSCRADYEAPADRRFHAEPISCPDCGPALSWSGSGREADRDIVRGSAAVIAAAVAALGRGDIVAVRGIGGYHLLCDAARDDAVGRLRLRKRRPTKPLAVMFPMRGVDGLDAVRAAVTLDRETERALLSAERPIVLASLRSGVPACAQRGAPLSALLAPGLGELGVFLPYSPLHHLLLDAFGAPLVATSGNISGEPVITAPDEAEARLQAIADHFLHHDRGILRPADDAVVRVIGGAARPVRLGRGTAPLEVALPQPLDAPLIALGGQNKVTLALGIGDRVVVSPHIGDVDTPRGFDQMRALAADLPRLYGVDPAAVVTDTHPDYASVRWARRGPLPHVQVQHHAAHASALAVEHPDVRRWLVFTWDGVGLGDDGTLWGGEALAGAPGRWRRVASFRPFRPPGGDLAALAPWRSAAALMWASGHDYAPQAAADGVAMAREAWSKGLNAPPTSAAGRLFEAAAALACGVETTSFEGEAAMRLEHLAAGCAHEAASVIDPLPLPLARDGDGLWRADWRPMLPMLSAGRIAAGVRAMRFHVCLAETLAAAAEKVHAEQAFDAIGLTGGVFQNRLLADLAMRRLAGLGHRTELPRLAPANDGGLALGQIVEAAARRTMGRGETA